MKRRFISMKERFVKFFRQLIVPKQRMLPKEMAFSAFFGSMSAGAFAVLLLLSLCTNSLSAQKNNPLAFDVCADTSSFSLVLCSE